MFSVFGYIHTQEFHAWMLKKAQTKKPTLKHTQERRAARLESLKVDL
jgi:hypothetical protein